MKSKKKNTTKFGYPFSQAILLREKISHTYKGKLVIIISALALVAVFSNILNLTKVTQAAGIDNITVTFTDSEATSTETRVVVSFTPASAFTNATAFYIYLGETTGGGNNFGDDGDQDGTDMNCVQADTTFTNQNQVDATGTLPMYYYTEVDVVGASPSGAVTCTLGDGATDGPTNPATADGYSIAVVTENDSGAGIGYVGNGNDVTVSVSVLPNLSLTIDNGAAGCTTTSGITTCNMGIATTAAVNTSTYDVNVGSNATSGITVYLAEDGNLRNGADDINDVSDNTVTANNEEYGIAVTQGALAWTIDATYDTIHAPIISGPDTVATSTGPIQKGAANQELNIAHKVAVNSITKALVYTHIVTWTATANF